MKLSTLLVLALGFPLTAHARKGPPRSEADAVERRVADLVTATGLSPDQATTVFAQLLDPPLAPAFLQVVDERRPDGTRNVFALMQVDYDLECRLVDDSGDCSTERGREQDLLFVQVAPDGRIHRTARTTPGKRATMCASLSPFGRTWPGSSVNVSIVPGPAIATVMPKRSRCSGVT